MPDRRKHRGPHPEDRRLFAPEALPRLRAAAGDLSWLLSRGYAPESSLKLVGDRYALAAGGSLGALSPRTPPAIITELLWKPRAGNRVND